ncbi:apolipoprotein D-like [Cherax quadricarinatus]|uniref:apolipoprotein D-like n=1 Tax=Cherax quadricarinatus TaxID=27406 RepID=UPI00387E2564
MMRLLTVVVVVLAGPLHLVTAHKMEVGRCKSMPEVENFDPDKLAGEWYVMVSLMTSSSCIRMEFNRTKEGFTVQHSRELFIARTIGFNHVFRTTGFLDVSNDTSSKMVMKMPYTLGFFTTYLTVVDTDYTQYAVLYDCTTMWFLHRYTVRILSRQPTLDAALLSQLKTKLKENGINVKLLRKIVQNSCNQEGEADFDVNIDPNTYINIEAKAFGDSQSSNSSQDDSYSDSPLEKVFDWD